MRNREKLIYVIGTLFYIVVCSILIYCHNGFLQDDAGIYFRTAKENIFALYPSGRDFYSDFLWHPFVINWARLIFILGGNLKTIQLFNMFFSLGIIYFLRKITIHLFGSRSGMITFLACLLYPNFYIWNLAICTEIIFLFFLFLIIHVYFSKLKYKFLYIGFMIPIMDYARELGVILILVFIIVNINKISKWGNWISYSNKIIQLIFSYMLVLFTIGTIHKHFTGKFITHGETMGFNMISGVAGDHIGEDSEKATREGSLGYIPNRGLVKFEIKDSIWKKRSIQYFFKHTISYLKPFPRKFLKMYLTDLAYVNFSFEDSNWYVMAIKKRNGTTLLGLILEYPFLWLITLIFFVVSVLQIIGCMRSGLLNMDCNLLMGLAIFLVLIPLLFQTQTRYHTPSFILLIPFISQSFKFQDQSWIKWIYS